MAPDRVLKMIKLHPLLFSKNARKGETICSISSHFFQKKKNKI